MIRKISTFLTLSILLATSFASKATVYNVTATSGNTWSNTSVSAVRGDTIKFLWAGGTHTTTSMVVPTGAATWDAPLDASHTSFSYIVSVTGAYTYRCTYHTNMQGAFLVSDPQGVSNLFTEAGITIAPNPASSFIVVKSGLANPTITITNVIGKNIGTFAGTETTEGTRIDVASIPSGTYFVTVSNKEMVLTRRIVITH